MGPSESSLASTADQQNCVRVVFDFLLRAGLAGRWPASTLLTPGVGFALAFFGLRVSPGRRAS